MQVKEKKSIRQKRRTSKAVENVSSKKKTLLDQRHRSEIVIEQCKPASTKKSRKRIVLCAAEDENVRASIVKDCGRSQEQRKAGFVVRASAKNGLTLNVPELQKMPNVLSVNNNVHRH